MEFRNISYIFKKLLKRDPLFFGIIWQVENIFL